MPRLSNTVLRNLASKCGVWKRCQSLPMAPPPPIQTISGPVPALFVIEMRVWLPWKCGM